MLEQFTTWLVDLVRKVFDALWTWITDAAIAVAEGVLTALAALLALIPMPAFLAAGMQAFFNGLGGDILYFLNACGLPSALAIIGSGYAFRLVRKVVTLFQW